MEQQKEIYVNEPMRFGGITIYQVRCTAHCMSAFQHCHCVHGGQAPAPCMTLGTVSLTEIDSRGMVLTRKGSVLRSERGVRLGNPEQAAISYPSVS